MSGYYYYNGDVDWEGLKNGEPLQPIEPVEFKKSKSCKSNNHHFVEYSKGSFIYCTKCGLIKNLK